MKGKKLEKRKLDQVENIAGNNICVKNEFCTKALHYEHLKKLRL